MMALSAWFAAPRTSCDRTMRCTEASRRRSAAFANLVELHACLLQLTEQIEPPPVVELCQLSGEFVLFFPAAGAQRSAASVLMTAARRDAHP